MSTQSTQVGAARGNPIRRIVAWLLAMAVLVGVIAVVVGGTGGGGRLTGSQVTDKMINWIDSGPTVETKEMADAVHANLTHSGPAGSAHDGCTHSIAPAGGWACYLQYDNPSSPNADSTGEVSFYFHADKSGDNFSLISAQQYTADTVGKGSESAVRPTTPPTTSSSNPSTWLPNHGMYYGTAAQVSTGGATDLRTCPGTPAAAGPSTSCQFAAAVFEVVHGAYVATGHVPMFAIAHSAVTGKTYLLVCSVDKAPEAVCRNGSTGTALVAILLSDL